MAGRWRSWGWPATVTVFAVAVALWSLRGVVPWELADQMGGVVGTALALVGFVQAWMQIRQRRAGVEGSPTDNLAQAVVRGLEGERKRLLGGSTAAVNITFRRRDTPPMAGRPAAERGEFDDISGYYETVHAGRLVITGGAGAGKTVLAMELIFALCTRREGDDPVPVRLPLAGWDGAGPFEEWLEGRLVDEYGLPPDTARSLVKARKVIPVLDGLDEMDPDDANAEDSRAAAALTALGDWLDGRQGAPLVLTCRSEWYDRLTEVGRSLLEATRIELERVSPQDAAAHLRKVPKRFPDRWEPLLDALRSDPQGLVARSLDTPWRLTLVATLYADGGDPGELTSFTETQALEAHLLSRYVAAACRTHPTEPGRYDAGDAHRWLAWIAGRMATQSEFAPHRMWSMAGERKVRWADGVLTAAPWVPLVVAAGIASEAGRGLLNSLSYAGAAVALMRLAMAGKPKPPKQMTLRPRTVVKGLRVVAKATAAGLGLIVAGVLVAGVSGTVDRSERSQGLLAPDGNPTAPLTTWRYWLDTINDVFFLVLAGPVVASLFVVPLIILEFLVLTVCFRVHLVTVPSDQVPRSLRDPGYPLRFDLLQAMFFAVLSVPCLYVLAWVKEGTAPGVTLPGLIVAFCVAHFLFVIMSLGVTRYFAFIVVTAKNKSLPWRLAPFLHWARGAGLLRLSGSSYEFRHRELQLWLADNPRPATG